MALATAELPTTWGLDEVSGGNAVLLGFAECSLHLLAPPGVRFKLDESDEERASWRHAVWRVEDDEELPIISIHSPDLVVNLRTSEVVDLLPIDHHDFVRGEMARQLCRAISFSKPLFGTCAHDEDAQIAGRTLSWVNRELADAFPAEGWFRQERPSVQMPNTIEEFLEHFSADQSDACEESVRAVGRPTSMCMNYSLIVPMSRKPSYAFLVIWILIDSLASNWLTHGAGLKHVQTPHR
jgi:hypothetical protein